MTAVQLYPRVINYYEKVIHKNNGIKADACWPDEIVEQAKKIDREKLLDKTWLTKCFKDYSHEYYHGVR